MPERTIGVAEARNLFSELLNRVAFGRERVLQDAEETFRVTR